jgi:hypothetical protein
VGHYTYILLSAVLVGLRNYIPDDDLMEIETCTTEIKVSYDCTICWIKYRIMYINFGPKNFTSLDFRHLSTEGKMILKYTISE